MISQVGIWTEQDIEKLKERHADGWTNRQIADELGKTRSAVSGKVSRLNLPQPLERKLPAAPAKPRRKAKPAKVIAKPLPPPVSAKPAVPVAFLKAKSHHCRAILDQRNRDGTVMFCGGQQIKGSSYCAGHHARYHQPPYPYRQPQTGR
jgi:hypothetical protein